jgi:D-glycero-D-manno-heptose 1,7-bisphosphate phosphatase
LKRRAIFLDRDGVLNRALVRDGRPYPPAGPADVEILPGVPDALADLRRAGFLLLVVTNQPDVARSKTSGATVEAIHTHLRSALDLDGIYTCLHDDSDQCACRKPLPGLLLRAAQEHAVDLPESFMVGDRWRDMEAGRRAGCTTILVDYGYREPLCSKPDKRVASLREAADWILARKQQKA